MRNKLRRTGQYTDPQVGQLARDVQRSLDSVIDSNIYKVTLVWNPPFNLAVPFFGGETRLTSPDTVECPRAKNVTDPTILVTPGGCSWEWVGAGQVRVDEVSGLTTGSKYELTFRVEG